MKLTGSQHETIEEAAATTATPHEEHPAPADAATALLLLHQTVTAYMLGDVDGGEVSRVQHLVWPYAAPGPRYLGAPTGDDGRAALAGELDPPVEHECAACGATTRERMADSLPAARGRRKWRDRPLPPEATSGLVTRDGLRPGAGR